MRSQNLTELFEAAGSSSITWKGKVVHRSYRRPVQADTTIRVEFIVASDDPVQGLAFALSAGSIDAGSVQRTRQVILWRDTAPSSVLMNLRPGGDDAELVVWNQWRDAAGVWASLGNQGMLIVGRDDGVELQCSDGRGDPDFADLVVRLRFMALLDS